MTTPATTEVRLMLLKEYGVDQDDELGFRFAAHCAVQFGNSMITVQLYEINDVHPYFLARVMGRN